MTDLNNPGNNEQSLNPCHPKSPLIQDANNDIPPNQCAGIEDTLLNVGDVINSWEKENSQMKKTGFGSGASSSPMQSGQIINSVDPPNRDFIFRYGRILRGSDEAMLNMFKTPVPIVVVDDNGTAHEVPVIWGTQEKAVAMVVMGNVRNDLTNVVDPVPLPLISIIRTGSVEMDRSRFITHEAVNYLTNLRPDQKPGWTINENGRERSTVFGVTRGVPVNLNYTLYIWTLYTEDMNLILEQIWSKFSPIVYIRVAGVTWPIEVSISGSSDASNIEPGDKQIRLLKHQFNFVVKTYISQPIIRKKAVLDINAQFIDNSNGQLNILLDELEIAVKGLNA